ncbi:DUF2953 domain-containing protein [Risungbinella massiliensis]|uniref:DUF2953 domain-containing protein n=1 Tax=Risungbinella massiliensis TaxID=1329796 RepID=UPI00069BA895|nr:DUF2953 domain-containing protein [Risungbinella massiliensis]
MTWIWILLGVLLLFFVIMVILLLSPLRIEIDYQRKAKDDNGNVRLSIWKGLIGYRFKIPSIDYQGLDNGVKVTSQSKSTKTAPEVFEKKSDVTITKTTLEKLQDCYHYMLDNISYFHQLLRSFFRHVECQKFLWATLIGTGDAAEAGVLTGLGWAVKTTITGFFAGYIQWKEAPELEVFPDYHRSILETRFHSIFQFRIGHAIILILRIYLRIRKGRSRQPCQTQNIPFKA